MLVLDNRACEKGKVERLFYSGVISGYYVALSELINFSRFEKALLMWRAVILHKWAWFSGDTDFKSWLEELVSCAMSNCCVAI